MNSLNIPNGGLGGFYSIVVAGFSFSVKQLTLMNIPTASPAISTSATHTQGPMGWVAAMFWVFLAKWTRRPLLCAMGSVVVCLVGVIVLKTIPHENIGGSLAALYIVYMYWAPYMVFGQLIMYHNVGGTSKKVGVFGISYIGTFSTFMTGRPDSSGYTVGNLVGPQSFLASEAPAYPTAYTVMLVGYCITLALMTLYGFLCWRDNKRKEVEEAEWREAAAGMEGDVAEEWKDLTDKQNPKFRYTY